MLREGLKTLTEVDPFQAVGEVARHHVWQHHHTLTSPHEALELADTLGLHRALLPKTYGGQELSTVDMMEAITTLGYYDSAMALGFSMTHVALGLTLQFCHPNKRDFFANLAKDHRLCAGFSEQNTTNDDVFSFEAKTIAKKVHGGYRLTGTKSFVSHGRSAGARYMLTSCRQETDDNKSALLVWVDTQAKGYHEANTWDAIGMRSTLSNQVTFGGVFVPEEMAVAYLPRYLASILIARGDASFGWYSMAYIGGMLRLIDLFAQKRPKYSSMAGEWKDQVIGLHGEMKRAGRLYHNGDVSTGSQQLLASKLKLGKLAGVVRNGLLEYCGVHMLLGPQGGETGEFSVGLQNLLMVHSMSPADRMIMRFQTEGPPDLFS